MNCKKLLCLLSLFLPISLWGVIIKGRLVDHDGQPIAFANVILLNDSAFIAGVATSPSGHFSINANHPANKVKVSMIGYEDVVIPITGKNSEDLGTLVMRKSDVELDEVVVRKDMPRIQLKGSAMVTKVKNSVLSRMGNAYDVLSHIPMVTGINGELTVFGRGTPTIYINGREIRDPNELQRLQSDKILTVELITNPGVAYASNINSVIRITTIPEQGEGFGFNLSQTTNAWNYVRNASDVNVSYNKNGLEIFGNLNLYEGKRKYEDLSEMTTFGNQTFFQSIDNCSRLSTSDIFGKLGFSWSVTSKHSFGAYYRFGRSKSHNVGNLETRATESSENDDSSSDFSESAYDSSSNLYPSQEANVYYNGRIGGISLDFNADLFHNRSSSREFQSDRSEGTILNNIESAGTTSNRLLAEKLIISLPVWNGHLQIGEEFTDSRLSYDYNYTGAPIENSLSDIHENNFAGFAIMSQSFGNWKFSLGIRYEYSRHRYQDLKSPDEKPEREYYDFFPSFSINTKLGKVRLSLDFTNKTKRPSYRKLDGGVAYINRYVYRSGNPMLKPTKVYNIQAMGMWRCFYGILSYNHDIDAVFNITRNYGENPLVKLMTFMNTKRYQNIQLTLGAQPTVGCWQPTPEIGLLRQFCAIDYRGTKRSFGKPMFSFTLDNVFSLPGDWQIGADFWFYSAANSQNCFVEATQQINLNVRKTFFNDDLMIQLKATDLLDRGSNKVTIYSGEIKNFMFNHHEPRHITLSVRYSFNKSRTKYKGSGAGKTEKRRM